MIFSPVACQDIPCDWKQRHTVIMYYSLLCTYTVSSIISHYWLAICTYTVTKCIILHFQVLFLHYWLAIHYYVHTVTPLQMYNTILSSISNDLLYIMYM